VRGRLSKQIWKAVSGMFSAVSIKGQRTPGGILKRNSQGPALRRVASTRLPTRWGVFQTIGFERDLPNSRDVETAIVIILGELSDDPPLVRIHSQCFTGEVLGSLRCDCGPQWEIAMQAIANEGSGLVIYEHQEGRGIGLMAKLKAYALQDKGLDTIQANYALGFLADHRDFTLPAAILQDLGISDVRLLSNNPNKSRALSNAGIKVVAQIPCEATPNSYSLPYLRTKKEKLGHALTLNTPEQIGPTSLIRPISPIDQDFSFAAIPDAIRELQAGRMIVVVDDEDRENEGDLTMAAEMITPEAINFMAMHGRGLICLAMTEERLKELDLTPMVSDNTAFGGTAFTVSIDLNGQGVTTGISAHDRSQTIKATVDETSCAEDFGRPGHIFPLCARDGGVLERRGQTEAAVDLARLAGLSPAGVICEILNEDGTMARVPDLIQFCKRHDLLMITVDALAKYRLEMEYEEPLEAILDFLPVSLRQPVTELDHFSHVVGLNA
jgi:3,4-dihydroxy-2-butanone 4-phosphate synthase/GTP cyclohydrolase II